MSTTRTDAKEHELHQTWSGAWMRKCVDGGWVESDFARDLERENAELRTNGQRWQNEHLRLLAENAELREALNLAFSIPQMSDAQLGDLIENCRKVINSNP
jgi:hypothetical protein